MGVYIKGMEMPKDRPQLLWVYPNGKALTVQSDVDPWKELQAVPVSPHGRLIDANALKEFAYKRQEETGIAACLDVLDISLAPTIIPAELPVHHGTFAAASKQEALKRIAPAEESE